MEENKLSEPKMITIMDLVKAAGADAVKKVDNLGWRFLADRGYDISGVDGDEEQAAEARKRVAADLYANGEELCHGGAVDNENGHIAVWFSLWRGEEMIARSQVLQLVPPAVGEEGGAR